MVALGAEVVISLIETRQLQTVQCQHLRRDASKYGRPQGHEERTVQDLADQRFGKHWLAHFIKNDRNIRRQIESPDQDGPERPSHARIHHRLDILANLRWRYEYPAPKHRQGVIDDSHLPSPQYRRAATEVRKNVEAGNLVALNQSICLISGLTPPLVNCLPIANSDAQLNMLGIDIEQGALALDLSALFPNRKIPSIETAKLFHPSSNILRVPLPTFVSDLLRELHADSCTATLLGDLTDWAEVIPTQRLVKHEVGKLKSSLPRASKSTPAICLESGATRLQAACVTWDFSLIGSARMYYARITGKELHTACANYYHLIEWGDPSVTGTELQSIGSHCQLTDEGARQLFFCLAQRCKMSWPGRNARLETLLVHHNFYTQYCAALVSFCAGLREVKLYRLLSNDLIQGQQLVTLHDKQGGDPLMAQAVLFNTEVVEQISLYFQHSYCLLKRLRNKDSSVSKTICASLERTLDGGGLLFNYFKLNGSARPAGSHNTWANLSEEVQVPGNVGRHYWQNVLRDHGLSSRDIDRFMRHRVVGLENNTNSQVAAPFDSYRRIEKTQLKVLHELAIHPLRGLGRGKA
jgi:hypothetical protein